MICGRKPQDPTTAERPRKTKFLRPLRPRGSATRVARISATDAQIEAAQKRLRVQGKRDDELFVVDSAGERAAGAEAQGAHQRHGRADRGRGPAREERPALRRG